MLIILNRVIEVCIVLGLTMVIHKALDAIAWEKWMKPNRQYEQRVLQICLALVFGIVIGNAFVGLMNSILDNARQLLFI